MRGSNTYLPHCIIESNGSLCRGVLAFESNCTYHDSAHSMFSHQVRTQRTSPDPESFPDTSITEGYFIMCHKCSSPLYLVPTCTVGIRCIQPPDVFPVTSTVSKLCNIECCVNKMLQIIQNMNIMVSQG